MLDERRLIDRHILLDQIAQRDTALKQAAEIIKSHNRRIAEAFLAITQLVWKYGEIGSDVSGPECYEVRVSEDVLKKNWEGWELQEFIDSETKERVVRLRSPQPDAKPEKMGKKR